MATSGSFETNKYSIRGLRFEWWRTGYSIEGNYSDISWTFKGYGGGTTWYYTKNGYVNINGSRVFTQGDTKVQLGDGTVLASGSTRIYHNADGTKSFGADGGATIYNYGTYQTGSGSWDLDTIPRYATVSQSFRDKNETSVSINWSTDATVDYLYYQIKEGSGAWSERRGYGSVNGTSGIMTLTGLKANTNYSVQVHVKRKDSQLISWASGTVDFTTTAYPYITDVYVVNLPIGDTQTVNIFNPNGRTVTVEMYKDSVNGTKLYSGTTNGTTFSFTPTAKTLYDSIPNDQIAKCVYQINYNGNKAIRDRNYQYSVYTSQNTPTFNNFTYQDINTDVTNVTGNNQILVKGLSNLSVLISSANKMVAKNSATPKSYTATIDTLNKSIKYYDTDAYITLGTVVNSGTKRLTVTAYDSRTLYKEVYKDITVMDYNKPVINATVTRLNNFENQTTLKVAGTYTRLTINDIDKNTITKVQYRYRETNGTWSNWTTLNTTVTAGKFTCSDVILALDNTKSFDFEIQAIDRLETNTVSNKLDVGQAIFFISSNKRQCYINGVQVPTLETIYPVGSIYMNWNNTNPRDLFGFGTWERLQGGYLYGARGTAEVTDYGSNTDTVGTALTVNQIPSHNHSIKKQVDNNSGNFINVGSGGSKIFYQTDDSVTTNNTGGGQAHVHSISYIAVFVWRRTA